MRTLLLVFCLVGGLSASAQGSAQTFYVIPPTNGCDGVWAVDGAALFASCQGAYTWFVDPSGCANWMQPSVSGDTIFYPLCSVPCDLYLNCEDGSTVVCQTGGFTSTEARPNDPELSLLQEGGLLGIQLRRPVSEAFVTVHDAEGRLVFAERLGGGERWVLDRFGTAAGSAVITLTTETFRLVRTVVLIP